MADETAAPDYYTRGLAVSDALEHDETLRVETDGGVFDLGGRDLYVEWQGIAPGEAFDILGRVDEAGELRPIDWAALQGGPSGYRPGRVYIDIDADDMPSIPAFVHATRRWNGFAVPVFTREALISSADALRRIFPADYMSEGERLLLTFDAEGFPSILDEQFPDESDLVVPVEIDGQTFYDIGGGGFTWMDAPREHEHYYDAELSDWECRYCGTSTDSCKKLNPR